MKMRDVTDELLREACADCLSWGAVLRRLVLNQGNRHRLQKRVSTLGIDVSHFTGRGYLKGGTRPLYAHENVLSKYLIEESDYPRQALKRRLLKEGVLKNECSLCGQGPEWKGKSLVMVLDHINGIGNDNRRENLRLLCPNCNSQTPTFCGRNALREVKVHSCSGCGAEITKWSKSGLCVACTRTRQGFLQRRVERPPVKVLKDMIAKAGYSSVAKKFGVTEEAVRKWIR